MAYNVLGGTLNLTQLQRIFAGNQMHWYW